jgi:enoyl-CoA hydratase/carnithine racemase
MLTQEIGPEGVRRVVLESTRGNSLDHPILTEIERAFDPCRNEVGPVVLSARGRSFCTGLDLIAALALDRGGMAALMDAFHRALRAVLLWPAPVAAAVQGHALAGGALLALCADFRVMARGRARFGVHGVQLGVVYPQIAVEVVRWRLGRPAGERLLYGGRLHSGTAALREGFVDDLVDRDGLGARAASWALEPALAAAKTALVRPVSCRVADIEPEGREAWLDQWFSPGTRARVRAAGDALTQRKRVRPGDAPD